MQNNKIHHTPFDSLEYVSELEYDNQSFSRLNPAKAGDFVAGLSAQKNKGKWHPFFDENLYSQSGISFTYTKKPIVIYFYAKQWGEIGNGHLKQLHAIQEEIRYHSGNLLIVSAEHESFLKQVSWKLNLSLSYYSDPENELSGLFGVYSDHSPSWTRYAGIDQNVPLPALYVLDHSRQVVFDFDNDEISETLPLENAINTLYQSNKQLAARRSA